MDRTADGPLIDKHQTVALRRKPPLPELMDGGDGVPIPPRATFIGRRREIRRHLRPLVDATQPRLFITGPGGVGKTTLAGRFARELLERLPDARLLGFRAPFDLTTLFETLRRHVESEPSGVEMLAELGLQDERQRIAALLRWLATRVDRPLCLVLDNLESLQALSTLAVEEDHADSLWLLRTVCALPQPTWVLLTGRYAVAELADCDIVNCPLPDAPYGDVLRRMNRLNWPDDWDAERKRSLYTTLGGNHRALEWLAELLQSRSPAATDQLLGRLEELESPPETPEAAVEAVLEEMRANLLLDELRDDLPPTSRALLHDAALYREPVSEDGLAVIQPDDDGSVCQALLDRSLLEYGYHPLFDLTFYEVPPIVRGLLRQPDRTQQTLRELHRRMAGYHEFQGRHVTRQWNDYLEAVYHYRLAAQHEDADRLAEPIADFYHRSSQFTAAVTLIESIIKRTDPLPPWWALNQFGMCQLTLGQVQSALDTFQQALPVAPDARSKGTTLNNIGQIFKARGDYEAALSYLEQSLQIQREIGDKAGEGTTLNNISLIFKARGDYEAALSYLEQSLQIRREIGDKSGEGATLNNMATTAHARGDYETALSCLEQSLQIQREIGDKSGMIATLHNIALQKEDGETAMSYWGEALQLAVETGNAQGIFHVAGTLGTLLAQSGGGQQAARLLQMAIDAGRQAGFPGVEEYETILQSLTE